MSARRVRADRDVVGRRDEPLRITVDGEPLDGIAGQSIAGVLLAADRLAWRRAPSGAPRGVFCGIGVCFDCLVTVGAERDVRACRRRARDGDVMTTQSRAPSEQRPDQPEQQPSEPWAQSNQPERRPELEPPQLWEPSVRPDQPDQQPELEPRQPSEPWARPDQPERRPELESPQPSEPSPPPNQPPDKPEPSPPPNQSEPKRPGPAGRWE